MQPVVDVYKRQYANTGSCVAVTNYLQHEDLERMKKGEEAVSYTHLAVYKRQHISSSAGKTGATPGS